MADSTTPPSVELTGPGRIGVACSGGPDSLLLLARTLVAARERGDVTVVALHVHHGLMPQADDWQQHVASVVSAWAQQGEPVECRTGRLSGLPAPGDSVEAWAREGRYRLLAEMALEAGCSEVLLGHHARDQAETLILQLLRHGSVSALAAMPERFERHGLRWRRPWLDVARPHIEAGLAALSADPVIDPSNEDRRLWRSRVRHDVLPVLRSAFPEIPVDRVLGRAARLQADARETVAWWVESVRGSLLDGEDVRVDAWRALPEGPRREFLRHWFNSVGSRAMPGGLLREIDRVLQRPGARGHWPVDASIGSGVLAGHLSFYRERLSWRAAAGGAGSAGERVRPLTRLDALDAPGRFLLPDGMGLLTVTEVSSGGLSPQDLRAGEWRWRQGGERFSAAANRPRRDLKRQFQQAGVPAWARSGPLLWVQGQLAWVPALGVDAAWQAASGSEQWGLHWAPAPRA